MDTKKATFFRHANNRGNALTKEGIKATLAKAVEDGVYTDFFHSPEPRTTKTLALLTLGCSKGKLHAPVRELGSGQLFAKMFTTVVENLLDTGNYNALDALKEIHGEEQVKEWAKDALVGLEIIFHDMEGDHALVVGHMPMIPLIAWALGCSFFFLNNLESITFEMDEQGNISLLNSPA